jgi:hypothetical protein
MKGSRSIYWTAHGSSINELAYFSLIHQGERIGTLIVAERATGESLSETDCTLLTNIARLANMADRLDGLLKETDKL